MVGFPLVCKLELLKTGTSSVLMSNSRLGPFGTFVTFLGVPFSIMGTQIDIYVVHNICHILLSTKIKYA